MMDSDLRPAAKVISRVLGWSYFILWSISFYPQAVLNYRRRSVVGLAIDFSATNLFGFTAYAISQAAFFFSPTIKAQYAARNPLSPETTVRFNDFAFALHGALVCIMVYSMFFPHIWGFKVGKKQKSSPIALGIIWGSALSVSITVLIVAIAGHGGNDASTWAWIDVIYAISYTKILITFYKYIPQALTNYRRKSTIGFSMGQVLCDFSGSILSLLQLIIDSSLQKDWSGITGNPVKFGLGNLSLVFNIVFMVQHFWLYRDSRWNGKYANRGEEEEEEDSREDRIQDRERRPLLPGA